MEPIKIGDRVIATFPNSCLCYGGTILQINAGVGRPIVYTVVDLAGNGYDFNAENVKSL
jgi:hypothetical protein